VIDKSISKFFGDLTLEFFDFLALKFNHLTAIKVDKVIVVSFGNFLVSRTAISKIVAFEDVGLFKQPYGSINSSQANVRVELGGASVNFFGVWMIARFRQDPRNQPTLLGHFHALRHA
jgi:hypothetical protein